MRRPAVSGLRALALLAGVLFACGAARAELTFPALTGRVVDAAHVLPPATVAALDAKLAAQEAKATDQVVVATVPSLQGTSVEDYANRLFRFWQIGQAKKNNGVLLLVAPGERKVRIEVGYGLEGILTDAVSSTIIRNAVVPAFKAGDMAGGIVKGTDAILEILNLDPDEARARAKALEKPGMTEDEIDNLIFLAVMLLFWGFIIWRVTRGGGGPGGGAVTRRRGRAAAAGGAASSWDWGGGFGGGSSGGGGGGGWSGGGGSSGGGGASGDW
ncbi:TPM domain-containing protein [Xanthobacter dioxanivorans]|uniref:TPM domain-containing protein n=1 Tax=Xanthobacter dioxanivorans TaxID=2528964 RepID=A0A974PJY8_9HYPH|nr:TPM domain-containing protein [Xanthobacter dioxanivorans]